MESHITREAAWELPRGKRDGEYLRRKYEEDNKPLAQP